MVDMTHQRPPSKNGIVLLLLSALGCLFIWIATPYSNFILKTGYISDDYLPASVLSFLLLVVLAINPVLKTVGRSWSLDARRTAWLAGILLMAASISSTGLLRQLPYSLARQVSDASEWQEIAGYYEKADLPPSLFPGRLGYRENVEVARTFLVKLPGDEPIPWGPWLPPAISWLVFLLFFWMFCISLSGIMLPQWQQVERLAFPLTNVYRRLTETPDDGSLLPPVFRERWFWIAACTVLVIYTLIGLNTYFPERVPAYTTSWTLAQLFTEEPLSYLPGYMKSGRFYFVIIGVAFFMSTRVSFSIWFFMLAYGIYRMVCQAYVPPFYEGAPMAQGSGALVAIALTVLWLGRRRLVHVFRCAVMPPRPDHLPEDMRDRSLSYMFGLGFVGMVGWLVWAGVQVPWAILLVGIVFAYQLVVARMVAETGLPVVGLPDEHFQHYFSLIPIRWVNGASAWFLGAVSTVLRTRTSLAAYAMQAMSLDEKTEPKRQWRMARGYLVVLTIGFFLCGAAHIYNSYHHSQTLDSDPEVPISSWGSYRLNVAAAKLKEQVKGAWDEPAYNRPVHMALGAAIAGGLQYASLVLPKWPLHPVGFLLAYTWFGETVWMSVMIGWLLRVVLILFGGARLYRKLKPLFYGLIAGEVMSAITWFSISGILAFSGQPYRIVTIMPF